MRWFQFKLLLLRYLLLVMIQVFFVNSLHSQDSAKFNQFKLLSNNLMRNEGKWLTEDPAYKNSADNAIRWIIYEYKKAEQKNTLILCVKGYNPKTYKWVTSLQLNFVWDEGTNNIKCSGNDQSGNSYSGESGRFSSNEISFDLLDPTEKNAPSYLRYNQSLTDSSMSIIHYKQEGSHWVFKEQLNFKLLNRGEILDIKRMSLEK